MTTDTGVPADGGQGAAADNAQPTPFFTQLKNEELRGYAETKGWKGNDPIAFAETVIDSYRNLEKVRGVPAERLLTLPEKLDDAEAMKPILAKLGMAAPETAADYKFTEIQGVDKNFAEAAQTWMHKHGVPPAMAAGLAQDWNAYVAADNAKILQEMHEAAAAEESELKSEWGGAYDAKVAQARSAARRFGFTEADLQKMEEVVGVKAMYQRFQAIGVALGESGALVQGDTKPGFAGLTPEGAKAEIAKLMSDRAFGAKLRSGDADANARWDRLNKIAAGARA